LLLNRILQGKAAAVMHDESEIEVWNEMNGKKMRSTNKSNAFRMLAIFDMAFQRDIVQSAQ